MDNNSIEQLIFSLTEQPGTAGEEVSAAAAAMRELSKFMPASLDALGNVKGELPGNGTHILLDAHIDQIGMVVTSIDDDGFLKIDKCGGMDARILAAHEVTVWGRKPLFGVVTSTPPHLSKKEDDKKAKDFSETAVDVGFPKDKACKLVRPGDRVTLKGESIKLQGKRLCSPALDDRAGVAAILRCLEIVSGRTHNCRISVQFSVQEETGGSGAMTGGFSAAAEESIAVDVSFAMAPDNPKEKCGELGKGPMIGIAPTLNREMGRALENIAIENNIPYQLEVMGGATGTNADKIQNAGKGTKMALVSVPLRNMHTGVEILDVSDVENTALLMAEYIIERGKGNA